MSFSKRSMKSAMRQANRSGAKFCLLLGEDELASNSVMIRDMDSGEQTLVPLAEAANRLSR